MYSVCVQAKAVESSSAVSLPSSYEKLSLEKKVGQLLILGFSGQEAKNIKQLIKDVHPGGLIVFSHNIKSAKQIAHLNDEAQRLSLTDSSIPLLISVDQEGGEVMRIRTAHSLPSALSLGETNNPRLARQAGNETGKLLKTLGFNMNLAPVLDIADPDQKTFIGTRSFGEDHHRVSTMGEAFAQGLLDADVLPTAKHFPGHGGVKADSHSELPKRFKTLAQLMQADLLPFKTFAEHLNSKMAMMVAHVSFPQLDQTQVAATYSKPIVEKLLRHDFHYDGLIMTDDLEMGGASQIQDVGERAVRAFEAGNDLLMIVWSLEAKRQVHRSLVRAIQSGRIPLERLHASLARIAQAKLTFATHSVKPNDNQIRLALKNPIFEAVSKATVSSLIERGLNHNDSATIRKQSEPFFVFSGTPILQKQLQMSVPQKSFISIPLGTVNKKRITELMKQNKNNLAIFYLTGKSSAKILLSLPPKIHSRLIVINALTKAEVGDHSQYFSVIHLFNKPSKLGFTLAEFLFNKRIPSSSIDLNVQNKANPSAQETTEEATEEASETESNVQEFDPDSNLEATINDAAEKDSAAAFKIQNK